MLHRRSGPGLPAAPTVLHDARKRSSELRSSKRMVAAVFG